VGALRFTIPPSSAPEEGREHHRRGVEEHRRAHRCFTMPPAADPSGLSLHVLLRAERAFGNHAVGEVLCPSGRPGPRRRAPQG
jgi:hypothetical protein